jgi:hypothetical protein
MPQVNWTLIIFGCVGGLLPDILRIIQDRYNLTIAAYFKSPMFYISLILLALLGGFSAWLLGAADVKQALAYGFGAPEIISRVLGKIGGNVDRGVDRGPEAETPGTETKPPELNLFDLWAA